MREPRKLRTVLIADDASSNRRLTARLLKLLGYHTLEAENGQQALSLLAQHEADLVLLDLSMPVMDGWTVLRSLRHQPRYNDLPILILTSQSDPSIPPAARDLGAAEVLTKFHTDIDTLLDRIAHYAPLDTPPAPAAAL
jgi:CheY-like chemotaxis protein